MEILQTHLGLSPEEMITIFNKMYLDVWEKLKPKINWKKSNSPEQILQILEIVVTAIRDGTMLALYENNERIYQELVEAGLLPQRTSPNASQE
jgi:CII-binding regulator of phage lambda lysogenization HflD